MAIDSGKIKTLQELNASFQVWLDGYYHQRKHGTTGETPAQRLAAFPANPLPYTPEQLRRLFFLEETRQADKTACISLNGTIYEIPQELAGCKIQVRYDPFDPSDAEIYYAGTLRGNARLLAAKENFHQNNLSKRASSQTKAAEKGEDPQQLTLFDAAIMNRAEGVGLLTYSPKEDR